MKEIIPVLHRPFQKTEEKGTLPDLFYEVSKTLIIPNPDTGKL